MDAVTLRLILIVAGGLLLAGLYLWERRRARSDEDDEYDDDDLEEDKREPRLGAWGSEQGRASGGAAVDAKPGEPGDHPQEPEQSELQLRRPVLAGKGGAQKGTSGPLILCLHITSKEESLGGEAIVHAASHCGLEPGEMDVFYRYSDESGPSKNAWFTVANMVKPGTFPFGAMAEFESPGLTLFSRVEGIADDPFRLELMLETARCLAKALGAEVRDELRNLVTPQIEERLHDRVLEQVTRRLANPDKE